MVSSVMPFVIYGVSSTVGSIFVVITIASIVFMVSLVMLSLFLWCHHYCWCNSMVLSLLIFVLALVTV